MPATLVESITLLPSPPFKAIKASFLSSNKALIDFAYQTNDVEALNLIFDLIVKQRIILGGSSGINIAGAIKLGKELGPGKTIVTILCDHGKRYASKIFNKDFLKSKNLPIPDWL